MTSTKQKRIERVYPLSPMQSGMLFHALKNEHSRAYFEQMTFRLKGNIDSDLLQQSFDIIFARYDILRTVFRTEKLEEPMQFVLKQRNFKLYFEDISHLSEIEKNAYVEEFAEKDREKGFDLLRDILMRASLFKMEGDVYKFVWSFHHILMDGWCIGIIYEELIFVYGLLKAGRPIELEPVTSYVNYINWLEQQDKKKGLEYWENYLEGYEQQAGIPKLKPGDRRYQLEEYDMVIDRKETRALNTIARKNQVTVNTVFQTLWGILLQKYINSNDVVFGAVVSGRPPEIKGIEKMVGLFLNTIPIRIKNRAEDNFLQLLNKVQEETAQSKNYEYVSLAEVQAKTSLKGSLIDHIMVFENLPMEEELENASVSIGGGLDDQFKIQDVKHHSQTNYDFNVIIIPGNLIVVRFNYNSRIYNKELIQKPGLHLKEIIKQVLDNPDILVKDIGIITGEEKQQVLFDFNRTAVDYPADKTIHELFEEQAGRTPDGAAVVGHGCMDAWMHGNISITFRELNKKSNQMAHLLREKGVGPDAIVGIMVDRSIELIIGILGILKAGGAYLPIDVDYPQERIDYMLKDSNAGVLLSEVDELSKVRGGTVVVTHPTHLCYLIYTSGSTGKPKGVMLEHRSLVNLLQHQFNYTVIDFTRVLQFTTISFDVSAQEIFSTLLAGGTLVLVNKGTIRDISQLLKVVEKEKIKTVFWPASFLKFVMNKQDYVRQMPGSLEHIVTAGEQVIINERFKRYLQDSGVYLHNHYGPSETHVVTAWTWEPGQGEELPELPPIGRPISNTNIYILDRGKNLVPVGIAGELVIGGIQVGRGYLNQPELTAEKFLSVSYRSYRSYRSYISKNLYNTGDLCRWLADGNIEFLGRIDQQVKIRGFRIELGEIENQLLKIKGISEAAVIAGKDQTNQKYLCAYIASESEINPQVIKDTLARALPAYMVPAYVMQVDHIPLTPNGKVDRRALPTPGIGLKASDNYAAPSNESEEKMVKIWAEILRIDKEVIGVNDNFFERGGDSLKATILEAKIHKVFNVKVPLDEIFRVPTPAGICSLISVTDWAREQHRKIDVSSDAQEEEIIL